MALVRFQCAIRLTAWPERYSVWPLTTRRPATGKKCKHCRQVINVLTLELKLFKSYNYLICTMLIFKS